jgi:hypothetical protein
MQESPKGEKILSILNSNFKTWTYAGNQSDDIELQNIFPLKLVVTNTGNIGNQVLAVFACC